MAVLALPEPLRRDGPRGGAGSRASSCQGVSGVSARWPLKGRPGKGEDGGGQSEGARNPTCFSAAPPGLLHSTPSPVDRERSITLPAQLHHHLPSLALQLTR